MEHRDRAAETVSEEAFARRFRLAVSCVVLIAIAMIQQPGRIVSDTKLDLAVDPGRFLSRATDLWDPVGYFGQVQNQAYGYFVPMGPFFWAGHQTGIEPWVVQRLWWALILVVAFLGTVLLARELRIGSAWSQLAGGFAFALSPRMISVIGPSSIEVWPMAVAPWVLLALVIGTNRRSPVAMAALSAVAVAVVGGVNAAATFAVVPLGALWLLMAPPSRRRRVMMIAWPLFVMLGTLWWLVPLMLLGRYSPPFLDFIEPASLTTFDTTLLDSLRGTSNWTSYLAETSVAGRALVSEPILLLNLAVVLTLCLVGLARRDMAHRRFLFTAVLVGLVLVTMGHTASHGGLGAPQVQDLLDGPLAPLRNTHKFDVVVRLPLVLGFVHLLDSATRDLSQGGPAVRRWSPGAGVALLALVALAGSTSPAWSGRLPPRGSFVAVPAYWEQASGWLGDHGPTERALVVPASPFGSYVWGYTNDDVMQPLASSPWGVRNAIPLAPPGNIRMLDAVERELTDGTGSAALRDYLLASGVNFLVVRNDLARSADGLDPELVYAALANLPGSKQVAAFGPTLGGAPTIENAAGSRFFIDQGWQSEHRAVEIYRVGHARRVRAQPASSVPTVIGSAESQIGLLESGVLASASVEFAADVAPGRVPESYVLTDGRRRQEVAFGRTHDNRSASLTRADRYTADRPVHDYASPGDDRWTTEPVLEGARRITASSSQSSVSSISRIDMSAQAWSAFDGDPLTSWKAAPSDAGRRSWVRIDYGRAVEVSGLQITVDGDPVETSALEVRTDEESTTVDVRRGMPQQVSGLSRPTTRVTVSGPSTAEDLLAISDVRLPAAQVARPLRMPAPPNTWGSPRAIVMQSAGGYRSGCLTIDGYLRCAAGQDGWGEDGRVIDRELTLPRGRTFPMSLTVAPIGGAALDALVQEDRLVTLSASSQVVRAAQASVLNAVDGDPQTAWVAGTRDGRPRLLLSWVGKKKISRIKAGLERLTAASRPTGATLRFSDDTSQRIRFDVDGDAEFRPVRTERVDIEFTKAAVARNLDSNGGADTLPIGVSDLRLPGTGLLPLAADQSVRTYSCGSGPAMEIDGRRTRSRIIASPAALLSGQQLQARPCGARSVRLAAGEHHVRVIGTDAIRPVRLTLGGRPAPVVRTAVAIRTWGAVDRSVRLPGGAGGSLLTVTENSNPGWSAGSSKAHPVIVNGWQQAWRFDRGAGEQVSLRYTPNGIYRAALVAGGALMALLLVVALGLARRRERAPAVIEPRRYGRREALLAGLVTVTVSLAVAGVVGLVAVSVGAIAGFTLRRLIDPGWLVGAGAGIVSGASVVRPWGGSSGWLGAMDWPQVMIAVTLGVVACSVFGLPSRRKPAVGFSTQT